MTFTGDNKTENNYLLKERIQTLKFGPEIMGYVIYAKLPEDKFLKQADSISGVYNDLFNHHQKSFDPSFRYLQKESIKIRHAIRLAQFQVQKRMVTNDKSFEVSDNFPDAFQGIDMNNPELLKTTEYVNLLHIHYDEKALSIAEKSDTLDYYVEYINTLNADKVDPLIKDPLMHNISDFAFAYSKQPKAFLDTFINTVSNDSLRKEIIDKFQKNPAKKGMLSQNFEFKDIDDKNYSLDQFKGKLIYIDLWASWCSPCISEFKHLKKLKQQYSDQINFVGIAWKDDLENWKYTLSKHNLDGIQLFSETTDDPFFKFYNVNFIPRFILLDVNGHVLDGSALPPSKINFDDWL